MILVDFEGGYQSGPVGQPLPVPLVVQVLVDGFPKDGVDVTFTDYGTAKTNGGGYAGVIATPQAVGWNRVDVTYGSAMTTFWIEGL